jgi:hypothetical protein
MANPHRGETTLEIDGVVYRFCFTIDALCALEDGLDLSIVEISDQMRRGVPRLRVIRGLVWAGLMTHHPEVDEQQAGDLIMQATVGALLPAIARALNLAFGSDEAEVDGEGGDAPADPPKARRRGKAGLAGTG